HEAVSTKRVCRAMPWGSRDCFSAPLSPLSPSRCAAIYPGHVFLPWPPVPCVRPFFLSHPVAGSSYSTTSEVIALVRANMPSLSRRLEPLVAWLAARHPGLAPSGVDS
ncbi:unnamed protein product, partial [Scytosiphon promiscuus]